MDTLTAVHKNVRAICAVEAQDLAKRTLSDKIGNTIAVQAGRMWFILFHVAWFGIWFALNVRAHSRWAFDPFPFSLLTTIVSLESIFLSLFILMSQNRSGLQADRRNHLDLQINLLSEDENTKMIQMLQALCAHHKLRIAEDAEITELAERTELRDVLTDLKKNLPGHEE